MPSQYCPACGHRAQLSDHFCRACGGPLTDEAHAAGPIAEAESLAERGRLDEAIATIQRAIGQAESPELYVALATLYLRRGGGAAARLALERALALDPRCAVAHAYAGGLLLHAGRVDEARERLDLAQSLAPDDLIVRLKRGEFFIRLGIFDSAKAELQHGLRNGGGAPAVREMAEAMLIAIDRRSRNSFTRKPAALPSLARVARIFGRARATAPAGASAPAAPEVQP